MRETDIDPDDLDRPDWNSLIANYDLHDIGEAYFTGRMHQIGLQVEQWGIDKRHHDDGLIFDNKMDLRLWEPLDGQDKHPSQWPADDFNSVVWTEMEEQQFEVPTVSDDAIGTEEPTYNEQQWGLRGVVDVKTKSNEDWLGVFNLRHLAHYAEHATHYSELGVPTFVYFTMVDEDAEEVGERNLIAPITTDWEWGVVADHYDRDTDYNLSYGELKDTARECSIVERTWRAPDNNLVVTVDDDCFQNFDYLVSEVL